MDKSFKRSNMSLSLSPSGVNPGTRPPRSPRTPHTPRTPNKSTAPRTPPGSPGSPDDDLDSLHSYSSVASAASCDHAYAARNGTTFSGRRMRYVVHCSSHAGQTGDEYLTPTQRAQRQLRRLRALLGQARKDLERRDSDIFRLTKEVVELRLYKASLCSPEERSNSSEAVTVRENTNADELPTPDSPTADLGEQYLMRGSDKVDHNHRLMANGIIGHGGDISTSSLQGCSSPCGGGQDMQSSFADSGHFEDMTTATTASSVHSSTGKSHKITREQACGTELGNEPCCDREGERRRLMELYERRVEELARARESDTQELKRLHNDRVEALLQQLTDVNTRYCELVPDYEQARERVRELEKQLEQLAKQLAEQEEKHNTAYLQMYSKGQQAERIEHADRVLEMASVAPKSVSVPELLQQLQITKNELDNIRDTNYSPERQVEKTRILLSAKEAVSLWVLGARKAMYRRIVEAQGNKNRIDPEVTLQFLKSAIYYFLTDTENHQGHLNAIESILGFSEEEKQIINKARGKL